MDEKNRLEEETGRMAEKGIRHEQFEYSPEGWDVTYLVEITEIRS